MKWRIQNGVAWVEDEAMAATGLVRHGFTGRTGGVSQHPYATLNLGGHVGDAPERVAENRRRALTALGIDHRMYVHGEQVHGDRIVAIHSGHIGRSAQGDLVATDGLCTDIPGLALMVLTADCVPVLFLDPVHRAIGACHAGWKGSVAKIAQKTVRAMTSAYKTQPEDLLVAIGPSIGPCCYEVGENVIQAVRASFGSWWSETITTRDGRTYLDLWTANRLQLEEMGVPLAQIHVAGLCTSCHVDRFYSYRAEHGSTGRLAGIIALC